MPSQTCNLRKISPRLQNATVREMGYILQRAQRTVKPSDSSQLCLGPLLGVRSGSDLTSGSSSHPRQRLVSFMLYGPIQSIKDLFASCLRKGSWTGNHFVPRLFPAIRWPCRLRNSSLEGLSKIYHCLCHHSPFSGEPGKQLWTHLCFLSGHRLLLPCCSLKYNCPLTNLL